ncbi:PAS domain-containing sensor histidine kinase [Halapricum desulfuricans]|uniref:histidine kinase n=1 Tax=Halapricum desulfuricans TaxID=2841257 RepID=A0A897MY59_9EURY|nr:PAS domain-containing protein [Halapricum desulfuricans]QSG04928.1 GAF and PAS domains [Halapricum desulfuricans]
MSDTSDADTSTEGFQIGGEHGENVYETIFCEIEDAVFLIDVEQTDDDYTFTFRRNNASHQEQTGISEDEIRGRTPAELLGEKQGAEVSARYRRCVEQEETIEYEETLDLPGGTKHWQTKLTPIIGDGDIRGIVGVARDVTERKEQRRELQRLKERLELAVEGANLGVWDWDMTTDEVEFNEQWAELLGHSLEEIEPRLEEWETRVHPDDLDAVEDALERHIAGEAEYYDTEHRMQTADGDYRWIRDVGKVVERDADGEPARAVGIHLDIDDRKTSERQLKEERDMFTQGPAVVFKWREAEGWPVEYVSENVEDVLGYTAEQFRSGAIAYGDIIHDQDRERVFEEVAEHSDGETDQFSHDPYRIVTPDGAVRWVLDYTKNVRKSGEITHRLGYLVDITERQQNEIYLKEAQEVADIGWWRKAIPSDRIYWSDRVYEMWGADGEGGYLDHERFREYIHPGDVDRVERAWQDALEGEAYDIEHRIVTGDGTVKWMREVAEFTRDASGEPIEAVGIVQDITERRRDEQALQAAQQNLRKVIDLVPDLIFAKNREGEYLLANEATAEAYGLTPADVEGKREVEILPGANDSDEFREDDIDVIESGEPKEIPEETLTTADGEVRVFQTTKIPYQVPGSGGDAMLGYARDITDLKAYEQTLEEQRDTLELLNKVMRHDIRNKLTVMVSYTELLQESLADETDREYARRVLNAGQEVVEIAEMAEDVTDVLLRADVDWSPVELRPALERQIEQIRSDHERATVAVEGTIPDVAVLADDMLEVVFRNILTNAIFHNDKDVPEVTVSGHLNEGTVRIRIADNGPGIADDHKEQIFAEGEQGLDSTGTGLGLYLVKTLVDQYGGTVRVEDNEPEGSVFVVVLPTVE